MRFAGVKSGGQNKRRRVNVLVIKATGLGDLVAFLPPYAKGFNDVGDVSDDVLPGNAVGQYIVIVGE